MACGKDALFDPFRFWWWLTHRPHQSVAGYRQRPDSCPLAEYIRASAPDVGHVYVYETEAVLDGARHALPGWARRFIGAIDQRRSGAKVRREEALIVLGRVVREEAQEEVISDWKQG